ncbi:hypothetical protein DIPPA_22224 [Diplonema papillatum]|nr:hypothetical protein DIPPA_22224 [Diplonema papillatum]
MARCALGFALLAIVTADYLPKVYHVDLSTPPEERWKEICDEKMDVITHLLKEINVFVLAGFSASQKDQIKSALTEALEKLPQPFIGEMKGLAACTGASLLEVAQANYFYDFSSPNGTVGTLGCTGIIANWGEGVVHGRNLDFGNGPVLAPSLRNSTVSIHYTQNGRVVARYTGFAGLVGAWTGQSDAVTLEGNERALGSLTSNLEQVRAGRLPPSMAIKHVLFNARSFNEAADMFSTMELSGSVYFILGGTKRDEGMVITRNNSALIDRWAIPQANEWFIVQTNYDHWTQPPKDDDRRDTAIKGMNEVGPHDLNTVLLYNVLSTRRVLNTQTIFTTIMSAADPELYTSIIRVPYTEI